jgi:hypothetical protein
MIRIQRFTSRAEAELARTVLESNGIPAFVSSDDAGGLHPELPQAFGSTAVVVHEEDHELALSLLDEEFGTRPQDLAELEAAAMAAGPADDLARPATATLDDTEPTGRPGPWWVRSPVTALLVALILVGAVVFAMTTAGPAFLTR